MKTKYIYSLIIIGLLMLPISTIVKGYNNYYENILNHYGNEFNFLQDTSASHSVGSIWGYFFECKETMYCDSVSFYFDTVIGFTTQKLRVGLYNIHSKSGFYDACISGNKTFSPINGWTTVAMNNTLLTKGSLYCIRVDDYASSINLANNVYTSYFVSRSSELASSTVNGTVYPFDCYFNQRNSISVITYLGYAPYIIRNTTHNIIEGCPYYNYDYSSGQLLEGKVQSQIFTPNRDMVVSHFTTPLFKSETGFRFCEANISFALSYLSNGTELVNITQFLKREDSPMLLSDNIARYYTTKFDNPVVLRKGTYYRWSLFSYETTRSNKALSVPRLQSLMGYSSISFGNTTGCLSYSSNYGKTWFNYTNYDLVFYFDVINSYDISYYENLINCSGNLDINYNNITGYTVYANYTGNTSICPQCNSTNLTVYEKIINATGTFETFYNNLLGWFIWNNYTGNKTILPSTNNHTVNLNFTSFYGFINWSGDYNENNTNISFLVSSNMSLLGNISIDDDNYFLNGILSLDPFLLLLCYLFAVMFFIFNNKTNQLFIETKSHYIFVLSTIILLLGVEIDAFVGVGLIPDILQRAMLMPFLLVFIVLLWLTEKSRYEN